MKILEKPKINPPINPKKLIFKLEAFNSRDLPR